MLTVSEVAALLRSFDRVLILTHIRPDGDTVGCAAGLCAALRTMGKTAYLLPNPGLTETSNAEKLCNELNDKKMNRYHGDAALVKEELDGDNWFYLFDPFGRDVFEKVINNICESYNRYPRKIWIINILPKYHEVIEKTGRFVLTNQFEIMTR